MIPARSDYSPLRHLALSIWLNHDLSGRYMAMYTVYFDAAGTKDLPVMFVAGLVSTVEKWIEFEQSWPRLCAKHGVTRPFHMTDFVYPEGVYKDWAGDLGRQKAWLTAVRETIKGKALMTASQGVVVADLNRIGREYMTPESWEIPLSYCALGAWHQIDDWKTKNLKPDDEIEFVYESGDDGWGHFVNVAREVYGFTPIPRDKGKAAPLELADHLAWEHRHAIEQLQAQTGRPPRGALVALAQEIPGADVWAYGEYGKFQSYFDEIGMPRKTAPMSRADIRAYVAAHPELSARVRNLLAPPKRERGKGETCTVV